MDQSDTIRNWSVALLRWKFRRRDGKERRRMSGETPLGESHRAGIMQFQTKITGIEKRLIAKGIEDYPSEKAFLILSRTETENKAINEYSSR